MAITYLENIVKKKIPSFNLLFWLYRNLGYQAIIKYFTSIIKNLLLK